MAKKKGFDTAKWDALAVCPYFHRSDKTKHRIVCEGVSEHTRISLVFLGKEDERVKHLETFCCDDYERCHVYGACGIKYEKQEG
jgi:hypothetical protein